MARLIFGACFQCALTTNGAREPNRQSIIGNVVSQMWPGESFERARLYYLRYKNSVRAKSRRLLLQCLNEVVGKSIVACGDTGDKLIRPVDGGG